MAVNETKIVISAEDKTKQAFQSVKNSLGQLKGIGSAAGAVLGLGGAVGVSAVLNKIVRETIDAQNEQAQLAAVLRSTGQAAGFAQEELNKMAEGMSRSSIFSAGDITNAQTRLLSYTGIVGEQFPAAMQAVIDMSARMGMSLEQSAETIGRALDIPSQGMTALTRQGFRFTEAQKDMVKQLEETGRTAEAQEIILTALESSYGGAAAAARDTLGGALAGLQNQFDDLFEAQEGGSALAAVINQLSEELAKANQEGSLLGSTFNGVIDTFALGADTIVALAATVRQLGRSIAVVYKDIETGANIAGILGRGGPLMATTNAITGYDDIKRLLAERDGFVTAANEDLKAYLEGDYTRFRDAVKDARKGAGAPAASGSVSPVAGSAVAPVVPKPEGTDKALQAAERFIQKIKQQSDTLGMSREELLRYEASQLRLTDAQRANVAAMIEQIGAQERLNQEREAWAQIEESQRRQSDEELRELEELSAAEIRRTEALEQQALAIKELFDPSLKLMNIQHEYDQLLDAGLITMEEYSFAMKKAADDISGLSDTGKSDFDELKRAIEGFGDSAAETFVDLAFTGKASFGDMVDSILRDLAKLAIKRGITDDLFGMADGFLGDLFGGFSFGGARASGGPVGAGKTYLVGERGPELFTPSSSGTIIPNDFTGGGNVSVNVNVDAAGGDVSSNADFGKRLGTAIKQVVQQELMNERRHGGALA